MGTTYTVHLSPRLGPPEQRPWRQRIETVLDRVNRQMSTYQADSEVSRFNRFQGGDWFAVSQDTARVVSAALEVAGETDGAFDITIAPLVNLWSFGPDQRPLGIPSESEIAAALDLVDYRQLEVRQEPPALRKGVSGLTIDLSGIAKGFAVDQVASLLDASGMDGYMIEIGGEVRTKGNKAGGTPWRIGLERPEAERRTLHLVLEVNDCCLASSGDYRNFFESDGELYSHEIDPRTGRPVQHDLASVSVIGPNVMTADAMATALMMLPPEEAWQLAGRLGFDVLLVIREEGRFRSRVTPGFSALTAETGG
jgi:thiamine biosynthesis lipoprotein